jgi:hypothetical protein
MDRSADLIPCGARAGEGGWPAPLGLGWTICGDPLAWGTPPWVDEMRPFLERAGRRLGETIVDGRVRSVFGVNTLTPNLGLVHVSSDLLRGLWPTWIVTFLGELLPWPHHKTFKRRLLEPQDPDRLPSWVKLEFRDPDEVKRELPDPLALFVRPARADSVIYAPGYIRRGIAPLTLPTDCWSLVPAEAVTAVPDLVQWDTKKGAPASHDEIPPAAAEPVAEPAPASPSSPLSESKGIETSASTLPADAAPASTTEAAPVKTGKSRKPRIRPEDIDEVVRAMVTRVDHGCGPRDAARKLASQFGYTNNPGALERLYHKHSPRVRPEMAEAKRLSARTHR